MGLWVRMAFGLLAAFGLLLTVNLLPSGVEALVGPVRSRAASERACRSFADAVAEAARPNGVHRA